VISLGVPLGAVVILRGIVTERVVRYLFVKMETIGGVAVQGKEVYDVVSEHGPVFWRKIKHHFIEMKGGEAYILCTSNNPLEQDFVGVFFLRFPHRIHVGKSAVGITMNPDQNSQMTIVHLEK
jgi:hypothetical protein